MTTITPNFGTPDKFDPKKNYTHVGFGSDGRLLEIELAELQKIQAHARAELVRAGVHSGALNATGEIMVNIHSGLGVPGQVQVPTDSQRGTSLNYFGLKPFDVLVNGNQLQINRANYAGSSDYNLMVLPEPPTFGTRDDLIFLEVWYEEVTAVQDPALIDSRYGEETTRRVALKWRIRTVAGVDFAKYPDGVGDMRNASYAGMTGFSDAEAGVASPQGGNSEPVKRAAIINYTGFFYGDGLRLNTSAAAVYGKVPGAGDKGLYIAGTGDQFSKDLLKTVDGFVYAIPLFRVKRRNSGGYREDNLNGAINYETYGSSMLYAFSPGDTVISYRAEAEPWLLANVGKKVMDTVSGLPSATLLSVNTVDKTLTLDKPHGALSSGGRVLALAPDRPDGKFANIVDKDDIVDLRHRVSLTGEQYDRLLDENFSKLMRGELRTVSQLELKKERFGLVPASKDTPTQLAPKVVKRADGTGVALTNLLQNRHNILPLYGSPVLTMIAEGYKSVTTSSGHGFAVEFNPTKDGGGAVLIAEVNILQGALYVTTYDQVANTALIGTVYLSGFGRQLLVIKVATTASMEQIRAIIRQSNSAPATFELTNARVYEVDQTTFDKVSVDPAFTGEELAKKFPYVASYPNLVENIFNKETIRKGVVTGSNGEDVIGSVDSSALMSAQPLTTYYQSEGFSSSVVRRTYYDAAGAILNVESPAAGTFTTPANTAAVRVPMSNGVVSINPATLSITKGSQPPIAYVPFGRWHIPTDYASGETATRLADYTASRKTFSDAQMSETHTVMVEAVSNSHQPNVKTVQATAGAWTAGDTIKIASANGAIGGVFDADTAFARVAKDTATQLSTNLVYVDDVSKLSVGDVLYSVPSDMSSVSSFARTVSAIDAVNKTITLAYDGSASFAAGTYFFEGTPSSSTPAITAAGIAGTWTGLGSKEVTFTITTPPTTAADTIRIEHAVHYPAQQGLKALPSEVLSTKVNGLNYVKSDTLKLVETFEGKVVGSTAENPHVAKRVGTQSAIQTPTGGWAELVGDGSTGYPRLERLDGALMTQSSVTASGAGVYAQMLFSFNVVEAVERQFGRIPRNTLAGKVQWVKDNVASITANWHGYGSMPGGNRATFTAWRPSLNEWSTSQAVVSTASSVSRLAWGTTPVSFLDDNGFVHFTAYAEPSDANTGSIIHTDYIELDVRLPVAETGYEAWVPDNPKPVLVNDASLFEPGDNLLMPFAEWSLVPAKASYSSPYELDVTSQADSSFTLATAPNTTYSLTVEETGLYRVDTKSEGGTSSSVAFNQVGKTFTFTTNATAKTLHINFYGVGKFKNPMLTPGNKPMPFKPYSKPALKKKIPMDFRGKVAGSVFENPHRMGIRTSSAFAPNPTIDNNYSLEAPQSRYSQIGAADGALTLTSATVAGVYAQQLFEFDLSHLGLSLAELKKAVKKFTPIWVGYGSGENAGVKAFGSSTKWWNPSPAVWTSTAQGTLGVPESLVVNSSTSNGDRVTRDQKVYVLVHSTHPAGAAVASEIYTDHVTLQVELFDWVDHTKKNVVYIRPVTKEIKLRNPAYSPSTGRQDVVEVTYKHLPQVQPLAASTQVTVLAEKDTYLLTDLGTMVGHKQGTHHWMNPLYTLNNDRPEVGGGSFGFGELPLAADSKGVNIGTFITISPTGVSNGMVRQFSVRGTKEPFIGIARFLVLHEGELKLLIVTRLVTDGLMQTTTTATGKAMLIPLDSRPLVKESTGAVLPAVTPTTWLTPAKRVLE